MMMIILCSGFGSIVTRRRLETPDCHILTQYGVYVCLLSTMTIYGLWFKLSTVRLAEYTIKDLLA